MRVAEKSTLQFSGDVYNYTRTRNIGEVYRSLKGSMNKKQIGTISKRSHGYGVELTNFSTKVLDEDGFVIEENIELSNGEQKRHKRNGLLISSDGGKKIRWDGNSLELNTTDTTFETFLRNMSHTIGKYPNTQGYYENLVGREIVLKVVEKVRAKN